MALLVEKYIYIYIYPRTITVGYTFAALVLTRRLQKLCTHGNELSVTFPGRRTLLIRQAMLHTPKKNTVFDEGITV